MILCFEGHALRASQYTFFWLLMFREALHEVLTTPESISFEDMKEQKYKKDISTDIPLPKYSEYVCSSTKASDIIFVSRNNLH